jgi:uroporphyrinogen III methyltransferase / synthase
MPAVAVPDRPLLGRRVLITRAEEQADAFAGALQAYGAIPVVCPTIRIMPPADWQPLDDALRCLERFDWLVFASANGVQACFRRLTDIGLPAQVPAQTRIAVVGRSTAECLHRWGHRADYYPPDFVAEALVEGIGHIAGRQVLLPVADIARPVLTQGLAARGAKITRVTAYRTVPVDRDEIVRRLSEFGPGDLATFTSPSTVRSFVAAVGQAEIATVLKGAAVACIGNVTADAAAACGLDVVIVARERTMQGLLAALLEYVDKS